MTEPGDLLEAVDALTLPSHTKVIQTGTVDGIDVSKATYVTHEALLVQLENAVSSTIGAGAGRTMTAAWALNVLDSDALYQFARIDNQIRDWCRLAGIPKPRHAVDGLRAWYVTRLAATPDDRDAHDPYHLATLRGWANTIRNKLNPTRSIELTAPCPACHNTHWTDTDGNQYRHPIRITYHDQDPDILRNAQAVCRACEHTWRGQAELRSLRWDVDEREEAIA